MITIKHINNLYCMMRCPKEADYSIEGILDHPVYLCSAHALFTLANVITDEHIALIDLEEGVIDEEYIC